MAEMSDLLVSPAERHADSRVGDVVHVREWASFIRGVAKQYSRIELSQSNPPGLAVVRHGCSA